MGAVETIKVEGRRKSADPLEILGSERGWGGNVNKLLPCDEFVAVSSDGASWTYLSILGIVVVVKVVGVGNKVERGVIFEEGTCIQQRARMLSTRRIGFVGWGWRKVGEIKGRRTFPDFLSFLPHVSQVGRPWKEP